MESISVNGLCYKYAGDNNFALQNIDFTLKSGDFCVICGESGSGKSTLLKCLAPQITESGDLYGDVRIFEQSAFDLSPKAAAQTIAFVGQSADGSIVCEKVWQELAFGLESLNTDEAEMRARIAETASYFGFRDCFENDVDTLSGGQKKLLAVAGAMTIKPKILLLDEPLSQLDGKSVSELIAVLIRINRELGVTVIIAEHSLTELVGVCSHLLILQGGKAEWFGEPQNIGEYIAQSGDLSLLPTQLKVWRSALRQYPVTLSVADCKSAVADYCERNEPNGIICGGSPECGKAAAKMHNIFFKYDKNGHFVINNLTLTLSYGCITALLGENAAGKSTLLSLIYGSIKPTLGKITLYSADGTKKASIALMPQDVRVMFTHFSVYDELKAAAKDEISLENAITLCNLYKLQSRNPMDLSGGEQKRLALALILLSGADILLLDEPTSGLDSEQKRLALARILRRLKEDGKAILLTSHDMDFCAECADYCAFMFRGKITAISEPHRFFRQNILYTTAAARISGSSIDNVVTEGELIYALCGENDEKTGENDKNGGKNGDNRIFDTEDKPRRKIKAHSAKRHDKPSAIITAVCLCLIAPTIYFGHRVFGEQAFLAESLCVIMLSLLPFFISFERSRPPAREIAVLATLTALAVAARAAFYFLPQIKPVAAIVIITGFIFGAQSGFLVGAMSMLLSNIFFGQGPWTPWQMLAMGLVGFAAGLVGKLKISRKTVFAAVFGFMATLVIYGGIVNPASAILSRQPMNMYVFALYYLQGLPMDLIHAASTFAFLLIFANPLMKILSRIKLKFAIES